MSQCPPPCLPPVELGLPMLAGAEGNRPPPDPHPPHTYTSPPAEDGGQSWKREKAADSLAANLYELVFTPAGLGFVLGNDGVLLRVRGAWLQACLGR